MWGRNLRLGAAVALAACGSETSGPGVDATGALVDGAVSDSYRLALDPPSAAIDQGETIVATASIVDSSGEKIVTEDVVEWLSRDPAVATVDDEGVITGVSDGTAQVTASLAWLSGSVEVAVSGCDGPRACSLPGGSSSSGCASVAQECPVDWYWCECEPPAVYFDPPPGSGKDAERVILVAPAGTQGIRLLFGSSYCAGGGVTDQCDTVGSCDIDGTPQAIYAWNVPPAFTGSFDLTIWENDTDPPCDGTGNVLIEASFAP